MPNLNAAFQFVIDKCNDPKVGYSQKHRYGSVVGGIQYYDCSSLMSAAMWAGHFFQDAGYQKQTWFTTATEVSWLTKLGWREVSISGSVWLPGDIVWYRKRLADGTTGGHTEMVYKGTGKAGEGYTMGAHGASKRTLPNQVSIKNTKSTYRNYQKLFRYGGGGATGGGGTGGEGEPIPLSLYAISAVLGNWWRESHINPGVWNSLTVGTGAYGLGQWLGGRRTNLFNFLDSNGYARDDGFGQIQFFWMEARWQANIGGYHTLIDFMSTTSTNLDTLTDQFCRSWEGVEPSQGRRDYAHQVYNYLLEHQNDSVEWIVGNRYLNVADTLNNAVAAFQALAYGTSVNGAERRRFQCGAGREMYRRRYIHR